MIVGGVLAAIVEPSVWWLAVAVGLMNLAWLWDPFNFWVRGAAPLIEMSSSQVRVTARGSSRVVPLDHFQFAEVDLGAGSVFTREATFASVRFVWMQEHAPGVDGFNKDTWWLVRLPLRNRSRRPVLLSLAAEIAAHGLPAHLIDPYHPERSGTPPRRQA